MSAQVPGIVLRVGGSASARVHPRGVLVTAGMSVVLAALAVAALATGDIAIPIGDVVASLLGNGDAGTDFIVHDLRLPRAALGILVGVALGISGAIFQSLTRNPLGSPDIVGFQAGSVTGALIVVTVVGGGVAAASFGALAGGLLTSVVVFGLARKDGRLAGFRLVLIGVGISALAYSINDFLLSRARIEEAQEATRWLLGSLNGRDWSDAGPLAIGLALLLPWTIAAGRTLRALELGDDAAYGLGVRVERARAALVALAVALVALATTAAGPLVFVALTAPQISRRLARSPAPTLLGAGLTGAAVVLGADVLAQRIVPSTPLPAGVVTGALGGIYLMALLAGEWRRSQG